MNVSARYDIKTTSPNASDILCNKSFFFEAFNVLLAEIEQNPNNLVRVLSQGWGSCSDANIGIAVLDRMVKEFGLAVLSVDKVHNHVPWLGMSLGWVCSRHNVSRTSLIGGLGRPSSWN